MKAYYTDMAKFESVAELIEYLHSRGETFEEHEHLPVQDAWDHGKWVCEVPGCDWKGDPE